MKEKQSYERFSETIMRMREIKKPNMMDPTVHHIRAVMRE